MSGRRSNYNCKSWFRCLVRMPLGHLPGEVFLAHSTKKAWIRPWICWRNYISHLAWEHFEIPPSWKLLPLWPGLQMKTRQDVYVKQHCESTGDLDKQNKTKNVVSLMWCKLSPYLAAHPDIEMLFWRSLMLLVVESMSFFSSSLNSIMWFSLSSHSLALLPVVGSEGLVLTTGASWSDEWQQGTASGLRHKQ